MIQLVGVGGIPNQPALDLCNDVLQTLLSSPNNWKFNKGSIPPFTTIQNQQDYIISGCAMNVVASNGTTPRCNVSLNSSLSSTPGLTESGTTVTATFSDFAPNGIGGLGSSVTTNIQIGDLATITGASQSGYNGTFTVTGTTTTSVTFTAAGGLANDGGQGINDLSWLERATLQDFFNGASVKPVHDIEVVSSLQLESIIQPPFKICMLTENIQSSAGVTLNTLTMRTWPVPSSQIWNVFTFYQRKAPLKTQLLNTWSPWPDDLGYVLRSGFYAKALDHAEDPRAPMADAKWQQDILKALDIRQQELRSESYFPDLPISRGG